MNKSFIFYRYILILGFAISTFTVFAQCNTSINTVPSSLDTINCGESIQLQINLPINALGDDFSTGGLGAIWSNSTGLNYVVIQNASCLPPVYCPLTAGLPPNVSSVPAPNNMFWFTGGPAGWLTTQPLDIQCLGTISLDYRHETQSPAPCDGPDQPNEGQYLEYRTQGGTWQQINYWVPVTSGGPLYQHCWNRYTFPITAAMFSPGTEFRIGTLATSAANWDQWAISNFSIDLDPPCGLPYLSTITGPNIPANYSLDTITVTPLTDSAIYVITATDGNNTCYDSVTVYVEQPSIVASVIPAFCAGSDTLDAVATITSRCNYNLVLRNYKSGGPIYQGWGTGQPAPNNFNYVDMYRNGNLTGYFTMGSGGQNATDTFPLPLVDGDLLETDFSGFGAGGPSGQECYYYIYDSQMAQVAATGFGPTPSRFWNTIDVVINNGGTGYNIPPILPQPTCTLTGGGGTYGSCTVNGVNWPNGDITSIVVAGAIGYSSPPTVTINGTNTTPATATAQLNNGANPTVGPGILVSCPVTTTYTYVWSNLTSGGAIGLNNPNIPNPISTVSIPTQYQVVATSNVNSQCIAVGTVNVPGTPGNGSFDVTLTSANTICNNGTPINITFEISSTFSAPNPAAITSGMFTFDVEDGNGNIIFPNLMLDASLLPFTGNIPASALPSPLVAGSYDFIITNVQDLTPCPVAMNNSTITIVVNDPLAVGNPPASAIELCTSSPITDTLFTSWTIAPDINGIWTYLGVAPPLSNLPFNSFNYSLDPSIFPVGLNVFQYQVASVSGCPAPSPSQVSINITNAPSAGVLPSNGPDLCMNGPNIPFDLNSQFTTAPSPFSPTYWTDITSGIPGSATNSSFTPSSAGVYTFRYTAPQVLNCPADIEDIVIEVFAQPTALISTDDPDDQICDGDLIYLQFNLTGLANYTIDYIDPNGIAQTEILNAAGNIAANNLPIQIFPTIGPNLYTITNVSDGNSCTNPAQNSVNVQVVMPPDAGNPTSTTVCTDDFTIHDLNNIPFFTLGDMGGSWTYEGVIPPISNPNGTFQAWDPGSNLAVDPFGTYRYTVSDPTGTCPDDWEDITIISEPAPNTGNANNQEICVNDWSAIIQYDLNNLLDGTQDPGGTWYFGLTPIPTGSIDPNNPIYSLGVPGNAFTYEILTVPPLVCTNNGSLPYITQSILIIHPEPVMDPLTFVNNPPNPISVPQGTSTIITVDMLIGTPPFTVSLNGNETPPSSGSFNILSGMSGSGTFTPNYDINTNPVSLTITSIVDGNNCSAFPAISTPLTVEPWPLITANANSIACETDAVNLSLEGIQGAVPLNVMYSINGTTQPPALVGNLSLPQLPIPINTQLSIGTNIIVVTSIIDAMGNICPVNLLPAAINIVVNPNPIISSFSAVSPEICEDQDAILEFNFSAGTPPFNVDINTNGIPALTAMTAQQYIISPSLIASSPPYPLPYNYLVTNYQDANGCSGTSIPVAVDITVHPVPEIGINPFPNEICEGESIALNLIPINTSILAIPPIYTVEINNGLITKDIDQNGIIVSGSGLGSPIIVNPMVTTTYTITNFSDPATLCGAISPDSTAILIVNEKPDVDIISAPSEVCAGDKSYITFIFTKGTSPWTINYNNSGFPTSLGPWSDTTTVEQILTSTTNYDFTRVTDFKGCYRDLQDNFDIVVNPLPIAELTVENRFICEDKNSNATLKFEVSSGTLPYKVFYRVNLDDTQIADSIGNIHTIDTNVTGDYKIIRVVDSKGCEAIEKGESITIVVNPTPTAEFMVYPQPTDINNPFISFVNQSSGHITSIWTGYSLLDSNNNITSYWSDTLNTNSTFIHEFEAVADTHYILLEVISDSGCIALDSSFIIIDPSFTIFVPDAFTPDNDLHNDYFLPIVNGIQEYTLNIYDRFGNRIFETNDYISQDCSGGCTKKKIEEAIYNCLEGCDAAWDGKINNEFAPAGNFVYSIILIDLNGKIRNFNGSLTLIR